MNNRFVDAKKVRTVRSTLVGLYMSVRCGNQSNETHAYIYICMYGKTPTTEAAACLCVCARFGRLGCCCFSPTKMADSSVALSDFRRPREVGELVESDHAPNFRTLPNRNWLRNSVPANAWFTQLLTASYHKNAAVGTLHSLRQQLRTLQYKKAVAHWTIIWENKKALCVWLAMHRNGCLLWLLPGRCEISRAVGRAGVWYCH